MSFLFFIALPLKYDLSNSFLLDKYWYFTNFYTLFLDILHLLHNNTNNFNVYSLSISSLAINTFISLNESKLSCYYSSLNCFSSIVYLFMPSLFKPRFIIPLLYIFFIFFIYPSTVRYFFAACSRKNCNIRTHTYSLDQKSLFLLICFIKYSPLWCTLKEIHNKLYRTQ
jgi:hypothetical protein